MKRFLAILVSTTAIAHADFKPGSNFYIGGSAGLQNAMHKASNADSTVAGTDYQRISTHKISGLVGISGGATYITVSQWCFGVEAEAFFAPNKANAHTLAVLASGGSLRPVETSLKRDFALGFSAKGGYHMSSVTPYVRLGMEFSRFTHSFQGQIVNPASDQFSGSKKYGALGIAPGLGVDMSIADNMIINIDTRYVFYPSKTVRFSSTSGLVGSSNVKPCFLSTTVGLKILL